MMEVHQSLNDYVIGVNKQDAQYVLLARKDSDSLYNTYEWFDIHTGALFVKENG